MAKDTSLCHTIREVNRIHHQDESRHIAFGRELVALLFQRMCQAGAERVREVEAYLKRYVVYSINSLYNPHVYRDAGIADPLALRQRPGRRREPPPARAQGDPQAALLLPQDRDLLRRHPARRLSPSLEPPYREVHRP
ncbi:hypothetical protein STANM309S_03091 [Streptomyces tanashiensis]